MSIFDRLGFCVVSEQTDAYSISVDGELLRLAFRRATIEHLFRIAKSQVGLSHFEG